MTNVENQKKKRVLLKPGDIFKIPLSGGNHAYGQYYHQDKHGPTAIFFKGKWGKDLTDAEILKLPLLFPPIILGIKSPFRDGPEETLWRKVGHAPINNFVEPMFKSRLCITPDNCGNWFIVQGDKTTKLGKILPEEYWDLESSSVWPADWVQERIENNGEIPEHLKWINKN